MDILWIAVAGVDGYVLYRKYVRTDSIEELARRTGASYRDTAVAYGDSFAYSIATVLSGEVSLPGGREDIALTFPGYAGTNYRVQQSNILVPGSWTDTGITDPGTGGTQTLTVPGAGCRVPGAVTGGVPWRYYFRVVWR